MDTKEADWNDPSVRPLTPLDLEAQPEQKPFTKFKSPLMKAVLLGALLAMTCFGVFIFFRAGGTTTALDDYAVPAMPSQTAHALVNKLPPNPAAQGEHTAQKESSRAKERGANEPAHSTAKFDRHSLLARAYARAQKAEAVGTLGKNQRSTSQKATARPHTKTKLYTVPIVAADNIKKSAPSIETSRWEAHDVELNQPQARSEAKEINPNDAARGSTWSADWTAETDPNNEAPAVTHKAIESRLPERSRIPPQDIENVVDSIPDARKSLWHPLVRQGNKIFEPQTRGGHQIGGLPLGTYGAWQQYQNPGWDKSFLASDHLDPTKSSTLASGYRFAVQGR